jgi:hypothetical protein
MAIVFVGYLVAFVYWFSYVYSNLYPAICPDAWGNVPCAVSTFIWYALYYIFYIFIWLYMALNGIDPVVHKSGHKSRHFGINGYGD